MLAALATAIVVATSSAWFSGYRLYAVRTGSMAPAHGIGDLVIVKRGATTPSVGDVITFHPRENDHEVITHRVISVDDGRVVTQGDANDSPDLFQLTDASIIGAVVAGVPKLGYALVFLKQPTGAAAVVVSWLAIVLLWQLFFPAGTAAPATAEHPRRTGRRRGALQPSDLATAPLTATLGSHQMPAGAPSDPAAAAAALADTLLDPLFDPRLEVAWLDALGLLDDDGTSDLEDEEWFGWAKRRLEMRAAA